MHTPVAGLLLTPDANHMCVRLQSSEHLPLMCFHNTPAGEVKSQSQISIELPGGEILYSIWLMYFSRRKPVLKAEVT